MSCPVAACNGVIVQHAVRTVTKRDDFAGPKVGAVSTRNQTDAAAYGGFLVDVATRVAESSKEGGFLGIGGTHVSAAEAAVIAQIKSAVYR
jgi:hypothetical protein